MKKLKPKQIALDESYGAMIDMYGKLNEIVDWINDVEKICRVTESKEMIELMTQYYKRKREKKEKNTTP